MIQFRILNLTALFATAAVLSLSACSDDSGSSSDTLLNAPTDPGHRFDVGVCAGPLTGGTDADHGTCQQAGTRCSGTLVAPNLILTAQHCVHQINYGQNATGFCDGTFGDPLTTAPVRVTTSDSVLVGDPKWYSVKSVIVPSTNGLCSDDIALLVLGEKVPHTEAVPVKMSLHRDLAKDSPNEIAVVGRGVISETLDLNTFALTTVDGSLERRILQHIPFDCAVDGTKTCTVVDYSSPPTNSFASPSDYFVIGAGTSSGDSGSGIFDQHNFVHGARVIGVTSAGTYGSDGHPNFGLISRIDTHRALILDALDQAADAIHGDHDAWNAQAD